MIYRLCKTSIQMKRDDVTQDKLDAFLLVGSLTVEQHQELSSMLAAKLEGAV